MRISTSQITSAGVREMLLRQADLQKTQLQLATQKRVLKPSDDPVASTSIAFLKTEIAQIEQFNRNGDAATSSNERQETALASVTNVLFRLSELTVSTGNPAVGTAEIGAIKAEFESRLEELFGLANTKDEKGDYIFSGSMVKSKPFTQDNTGNVVYSGDQDQRSLRVSSGTTVATSDSGFETFVDVKNGNGTFVTKAAAANSGSAVLGGGSYSGSSQFIAEPYDISFAVNGLGEMEYTVTGRNSGTVEAGPALYQTGADINFQGIQVSVTGAPQAGDSLSVEPSSSQDIFTTVQNIINALDNFSDTAAGRAELRNVLANEQSTLKNHEQNIDTVRAKVGARLNTLESEYTSNLSLLVTSQSSLSDVEDLDIVEASTRLSQQLIVLEAAQASFVRIQDLNLFNYLR